MRKFYFLWGTIRPDFAKITHAEWIAKCSDPSNVFTKFAVKTLEQKQQIDSFNLQNCDVIIVDDRTGYNNAVTVAGRQLECNDDDIILYLSDDFTPPDKWDVYINKKFENWNDALFLHDGYQQVVKDGMLCITLGCMTFSCLKKLNKILFHPDYIHFFSDNEAFINLKELGLLKDDRDIDNVVFQHNHYVTGRRKQDEHDLNNYASWEIDKATSIRRLNMPIEERLK